MLRRYVFEGCSDERQLAKDGRWVEQAAADSSVRERCAQEAERAVDDMKKAQYMERYVGNTYEGRISGITRFGLFVELENTIEGLVHISSLKDDRYQYHEEALCLIGEHTANVYRMGDAVKVRCVGANRWKRQIDFELIEGGKRRRKRAVDSEKNEVRRKPRGHRQRRRAARGKGKR